MSPRARLKLEVRGGSIRSEANITPITCGSQRATVTIVSTSDKAMSDRTNQTRHRSSAKKSRATKKPAAYARAPRAASSDRPAYCEAIAAPANNSTASRTVLLQRVSARGGPPQVGHDESPGDDDADQPGQRLELSDRAAANDDEVAERYECTGTGDRCHAWPLDR